jgi:hypothetical protein
MKPIQKIKTPIIPYRQQFAKEFESTDLNLEAICVFMAIGFFLEKDTYYKGQIALQPGSEYEIDENGLIVSESSYWKWNYNPRNISLKKATEEFTDLFESLLRKGTDGKKVILPLSGGLDSRTQVVAHARIKSDVHAYGYKFQNGHSETYYGERIAKAVGFPFENWEIKQGYLWECIDELAAINGCYADFINARAMAFSKQYANLGEIFSLGHWGDVLFDDMKVDDNLPVENQIEVLIKKLLKKGGLELAEMLWEAWGLQGKFKDYLRERISVLLHRIDIPDSANARIRAFKSLYWAPRWTSANMPVFEKVRPIYLPYYEDEMCEFVCTIPENILAKRQIQIEYIKLVPSVAKVMWQENRPFNLYNYQLNKAPWNLPYRIINKLKNTKHDLVQRNWEIQFLGDSNAKNLEKALFDGKTPTDTIPVDIMNKVYSEFKSGNKVQWAHPLSMLLTLSYFERKHNGVNHG